MRTAFVQLVLVRGKVIRTKGMIVPSALGQADTSMAPVLLEPMGAIGEGGSVTLSGDYKV